MGARGVEATYNFTMSPADSKLCQWTAIATLTIPPAKQAAGKRTLSGSWVQAAADCKAHARNIQFHAIAVGGTSLTHRTALHTASRRASCRRAVPHCTVSALRSADAPAALRRAPARPATTGPVSGGPEVACAQNGGNAASGTVVLQAAVMQTPF